MKQKAVRKSRFKFLSVIKYRPYLYLSLVFVTICVAYIGILIAPVSFKNDDFTANIIGDAIIIRNFFLHHQLGLWDNTNGLGFPLIASTASHFYPFLLVEYFLPNIIFATRYVTLIHMILAGIVMFYFLRLLKCNLESSFLGAMLYVINYYVEATLTAGSINEVFILLWMPLCVAFFWFALFDSNKKYAVIAGIALGMHFFSKTSFSLYFTLLIILLLPVFYFFNSLLIQQQKLFKAIKNTVLLTIILFVTAFGLAAVKVLPAYEYANLSVRMSVPLYGSGYPFHPGWEMSTISSLFRYLTNIIVRDISFTKYTPINLAFLIFVLIGATRRTKESLFFALVSVFSLWATMGKNAPIDLYAIFYRFAPGINTIEHPYRFFTITNFTFPILAAIGATYVYRKFPRLNVHLSNIRIHIVTVAVFLIVIASSVFVWGQMSHFFVKDNAQAEEIEKNDDLFNKELSKLIKQDKEIVHVTSLYDTIYRDVFYYSGFIYNFRLTNPYILSYMLKYQFFPLSTYIPNSNFLKDYYSLNSDQAFIEKKYKLLSLMNSKYLVTKSFLDDYPNKYIAPILKQNDGILYRVNSFLPYVNEVPIKILLIGDDRFGDFNAFRAKMLMLDPRVNLAHVSFFTTPRKLSDFSSDELQRFNALILTQKPESGSQGLIGNYIKNGGNVLNLPFQERNYNDTRARNYSLLSKVPAEYLIAQDERNFVKLIDTLDPKQQETAASISFTKDTPEYISLEIRTKKDNTAFRIASTYYPGWKLYIDNSVSQLYMADGLTEGFVIPKKGQHTAILVFRPITFYLGAIISVFTVFVLLLYFLKPSNSFIKGLVRKYTR